jgi:hypothetical protein
MSIRRAAFVHMDNVSPSRAIVGISMFREDAGDIPADEEACCQCTGKRYVFHTQNVPLDTYDFRNHTVLRTPVHIQTFLPRHLFHRRRSAPPAFSIRSLPPAHPRRNNTERSASLCTWRNHRRDRVCRTRALDTPGAFRKALRMPVQERLFPWRAST